jgi:two-component system, OmpR family, sensor histidine kinase BaeS
VRGVLRRPPRPLPDWWPEGRPWPPVTAAPRPMPAWWPDSEAWPAGPVQRSDTTPRFPLLATIVFAVALHLIVIGVLAIAGSLLGPGWLWPSWPLTGTLIVAFVFVAAMRRVGMPLTDIVGASKQIASGDLSARVEERGLPWIRSMAQAFNAMTARLDRQQRERRDMIADIAHELRTPLAVMQGRLEGMLDGVYPRDDAHVTQVLDETRMLARLVEDLRTAANAESGALTLQREPTDYGILVEDAAAALATDARLGHIRIDVQTPDDLPLLHIDPVRVREVLINLLSNALHHAPHNSTVTVVCHSTPTNIVTRIEDRGPGIRPDDLPRVFDRFHKGKGSTGSGLGLTIARSLVTAHGGSITAENRQGGGASIIFLLPLDARPQDRPLKKPAT